MKNILKLIGLFGMIATVVACSTGNSTKPQKLITHAEARDSLRRDTTVALQTFGHKHLYGESLYTFFKEHPIDKLLYTEDEYDTWAMNGFFGTDNYRIELYIDKAEQDASRPNVYKLFGKSRFKKNISVIVGTLTLDSVATFTDPNLDTTEIGDLGVKQTYTVCGTFEIREDTLAPGSGVFRGRFEMDAYTAHDTPELQLWYFSSESPTKGAGYVYRGEWQSNRTKKKKAFVFAEDFFAISNDILKDFSIGERDVEINPKYRHLGWDIYWENDEWWAEKSVQ